MRSDVCGWRSCWRGGPWFTTLILCTSSVREIQQVSTELWKLWADNPLICIYRSRMSNVWMSRTNQGGAGQRRDPGGLKRWHYSTTYTAIDVHQLVPLSKKWKFRLNEAQLVVAKLLVRARHTKGIYSFVWLDFRWIYGKPCSAQVYSEDMRFIKSCLMCVAAVEPLLLCGSMHVSCTCIQMQLKPMQRNELRCCVTHMKRKVEHDQLWMDGWMAFQAAKTLQRTRR